MPMPEGVSEFRISRFRISNFRKFRTRFFSFLYFLLGQSSKYRKKLGSVSDSSWSCASRCTIRSVLSCIVLVIATSADAVEWKIARPDYSWTFPEDHWAHDGYKTEWWYFTGHLRSVDRPMRRFGYQFTFFKAPSSRTEETPSYGYILKANSPSCGIDRVKVYEGSGAANRAGRGLFAATLAEMLPLMPIEKEARLNDNTRREEFVKQVFAYWENESKGFR